MDAKKDSRPSQAQKAQRPTKLVLGLRALVLGVTIAGIVVSSIPAPKNFIAIGILGPAFVTTFCWSLIELVYPLVRIFPPAYISFRIFIDGFIVIGSVICLICFGLFRDWWPGGSALSSSEAPLAREILFQAALGLACASTGPFCYDESFDKFAPIDRTIVHPSEFPSPIADHSKGKRRDNTLLKNEQFDLRR
ncbi:hypothetical protein FOC4_g10002159 [Fusarium odoratissimum]|uniref:Uncharacterized protein n=2 Tax=Fusarium oxysporum species complex TaxID=171631 RepID=N1S4C8_FUSC4|nr:hypothetical protein FOC4_g10002159 [Fusarium odoratissimum]TXB98768.1 hypothetical protein FocTR4_00012374 [Fusarium oxysporum f. sp. cubense]